MPLSKAPFAQQPIAVLGAGSWGTALAIALAKNKQTVQLWDCNQSLLQEMEKANANVRYLPEVSFPTGIVVCHSMEQALVNVQNILIAVPSHTFSAALKELKTFLIADRHRIVWATKGLESGTSLFLHQVVERELGAKQKYAVLSGPSFAKEVALGLPTAVMIASEDLAFANDLARCFQQSTFGVKTTDDVVGVQLGGAVKNVLAVAVGISDGVGFGANARAALITMGLSEMMRLGRTLGARPETLMGLAGCGDVILTCTDNQSRNRRFGLALAEGLSEKEAMQRIGQVVEAVYNVEQLCHLARANQVELLVVEQVFRVLKHGMPPKQAIKALFEQVSESL